MNITTFTSQRECLQLMDAAGVLGMINPIPPNTKCDALVGGGINGSFLAITNDCGEFTCYYLQECSQKEALDFIASLTDTGHTNMRVSALGQNVGAN